MGLSTPRHVSRLRAVVEGIAFAPTKLRAVMPTVPSGSFDRRHSWLISDDRNGAAIRVRLAHGMLLLRCATESVIDGCLPSLFTLVSKLEAKQSYCRYHPPPQFSFLMPLFLRLRRAKKAALPTSGFATLLRRVAAAALSSSLGPPL